MAYDHDLAGRIRGAIGDRPDLVEKQMFGGVGFLVGGNMAVGVSGKALMVRMAAAGHDAAMARPGVRPFEVGGRSMRGWLLVDPVGIPTDEALQEWVNAGVRHAETLPPK